MTFSNPAGNAAAAAAGYVRALLDLLGDRDPLDVLAETLPWLDRRLEGIDDERLRRPEAPGKWSVIEIVQHLADSDVVVAWRSRLILAEDRPAIQGYDQDAWVRSLDYRHASLEVTMGQLRGVRLANLRLWRGLTSAQLARVGIHTERGSESLDRLLRLMGGHDLVHRRQIERVLAAVGAPAR